MVVLSRNDVELATWPLWWWGRPGLEAVDELARLRLVAGRLGCSIRLRGACVELRDLLDLVGLGEVLLADTGRSARTGGEPEGGDEIGPPS
jgi:hypothetical protein